MNSTDFATGESKNAFVMESLSGVSGEKNNPPDSEERETYYYDHENIADFLQLRPRVRDWLEKKELQENETALIDLIETGDLPGVVAWIKERNFNINRTISINGIMVTALQVAAENNSFEMVYYLLSHGAERLKEPEVSTRKREDIDIALKLQLFKFYAAISSPAYICFTSDDPLHTAFEISERLRKMEKTYGPCSTSNVDLSNIFMKIEDFTVELLEMCEDSATVQTVLHGEPLKNGRWKTVNEAIAKNQKKFISHSHTQEILRSAWLNGQPKWSEYQGFWWNILYAVFAVVVCGLLHPLLALLHIAWPHTPFIMSPKTRFISYLFSYFALLYIMLVHRTPFLSFLQALSFLVYELQQAMEIGFSKYIRDVWNVIDICNFTSLALSHFVYSLSQLPLSALSFHTLSVLLIIFSRLGVVTLVFINLRTLQYLYLLKNVGSILVIFIQMSSDIFNYFCLFMLVVIIHAIGILHNYDSVKQLPRFEASESWNRWYKAILNLMWSLYGSNYHDELNVSLINTGVNETSGEELKKLNVWAISITGNILYGMFCFFIITILLNLGIAMMSETYTKIKENIDIEWTFCRTTLWMDFIRGPILPPPFNLIPTRNCIMKIFKSMFCKSNSTSPENVGEAELCHHGHGENNSELPYKDVLRVLTMQYVSKHIKLGSQEPVHRRALLYRLLSMMKLAMSYACKVEFGTVIRTLEFVHYNYFLSDSSLSSPCSKRFTDFLSYMRYMRMD
ncbi:transient-receptor-potential-like protein isoform X2 [Ptychodera flava]|uniref:transient-receptor-potential-like protein isoform X2 n=1 Tax=Ptychodera flava TaxID=63121 RepID=UPI00396A1248